MPSPAKTSTGDTDPAPQSGRVAGPAAHMGPMRTITQHAEILELPMSSIIVDDGDTPMQIIDPNLLGILAGPDAGDFRVISDPTAVLLPATVRWEPVS